MLASAYSDGFQLTSDQEPQGQFKGTVNKREEFILKCVRVISLNEGYYVKVYLFEDLDGNSFVWFASKDSVYEVGQTYRIRLTVKRHSVYRNVRQTHMLRPKLVSDYIAPVVRESKDMTGKTITEIWNDL